MKWLVLSLALWGCSQPQTPVVPETHTSPVVIPTPTGRYAGNTPATTRDAHRQAIAHLRAQEWSQACDGLDGVLPRSDRRALTEYLTVLCSTRLPDRALSADGAAAMAASPTEAPALLDAERDSLNRYRAWVAAVQDSLADAAMSSFHLSSRPLPPDLQNSHNLSAISAWRTRGSSFDAATYNSTFHALQTTDFATRLALQNLLATLTPQTASDILFADVTGMHLPSPPPLVLPNDSDL